MDVLKKYLYSLATDKSRGFASRLIKPVFYVLSVIYGLIVRAAFSLSSKIAAKLNCKVISVGNITLGGTGKTPLVELIADYLRSKGKRIAILSRGYMRPCAVCDKTSLGYQGMGDEPYMLSLKLKNIPVIVDKNRARSAKRAMAEFASDTVILDDGFQQWRIDKDLDIVTLDADNPWGNKNLIPRGILREPLSCLKRADVLVLTKADKCADIEKVRKNLIKINPQALIVQAQYQPVGFLTLGKEDILLSPDTIEGQTVVAVSGIADPVSFECLIKKLGADIGLSFQFPDHHQYCRDDLENVARETESKGIRTLVITEKDAVKIKSLWQAGPESGVNFLVLRVRIRITENEDRFFNRLLGLYNH
jgi:tetraacyldisaccharide 4'-kinase